MGKPTRKQLERMRTASGKCFDHARTCRECYHLIFDEEGNPQYVSEACAEGAKLLTEFRQAEADCLNHVGL